MGSSAAIAATAAQMGSSAAIAATAAQSQDFGFRIFRTTVDARNKKKCVFDLLIGTACKQVTKARIFCRLFLLQMIRHKFDLL
jgi:hypothetical protein